MMAIGIKPVINLWRKRSKRLSRLTSCSASLDASFIRAQIKFYMQYRKRLTMTNLDGEKLSMEEVKQTIREYILADCLPGATPAESTDSAPLITGGILDSLATIKLVAFLEQRFKIQIQAHETMVDYLDTVSD